MIALAVALGEGGRYIAVTVGNGKASAVLRRFPWPNSVVGRIAQRRDALDYAGGVAKVLDVEPTVDAAIDVGVEVARLGMLAPNHDERRRAARAA